MGRAEPDLFLLLYLAPDVIKDQCSVIFPILDRGRAASWEQLALCPCNKARPSLSCQSWAPSEYPWQRFSLLN